MMRQTNHDEVTEKNVYTDVYRLLIAGMLASTIFFVIGLILALLHPQSFSLSADWIRHQYQWSVIRHGLATGDPMIFLMIATVLLILTPVARVIVSIYAFFVDGDTKYVVVTSIVLGIMILTVILGIFGVQ
ncbi:MAG TPA: DUF1634 domain-containing protein [Candidatus Dormibacteraeota bacterium]|nr:DUF1634 domain-containing protein [Candidatus Dormibacteraeota bacterium]